MSGGDKSKRSGISGVINELNAKAEADRAAAARALQDRRNSRSRRQLLAMVAHLERENAELDERNEALLDMASYKPRPVKIARRTRKQVATGLNRCLPIVCASDWHIGEDVEPKTIWGLNEYNPEIARARAAKLFQNAHALIDINRHGAIISGACLWLGGDLITGRLHDDAEGNWLSPIEQTHLAFDVIVGGIDYLLAKADLASLLVVTNHGNHGRTHATDRRVATAAENNHEFDLYHQLRRHYALTAKLGGLERGRVEFKIADGAQNWIELEGGIAIRTTHGDGFGYGGGVGGLTIPMNKAIARWNTQPVAGSAFPRPALYDIMGHWHQYTPGPIALVNGSLSGWSPYAQRVGSYEEPQQAFCMVDLDTPAARKVIGHFPIRVR